MSVRADLTRVAVVLCLALAACGSTEAVQGVAVPDTGGKADTFTADVTDDIPAPADADVDAAPDVAPADVAQVPCTAAQVAACDDKLDCTADSCIPGGVCAWKLKPAFCLIGGVCRADGDKKAGDACSVCAAATAPKTWSVAADGSACDDSDACTFNDVCKSSNCKGEVVQCDDKNPCTADVCTPKTGCSYPPVDGNPACDDGNACTSGDKCAVGLCAGVTADCDDKNPCTDDACNLATGCTHTDNTSPCSDGNGCTSGDTCTAGACVPGGPANCDDGNTCTLDSCQGTLGCYHLPTQSPCCIGQTSICDDGNPCTSDLCDPATSGCSHEPNSAVCSDGNACTGSDSCAGGSCKGVALSCNDNSPCTADACDPASGCIYTAVDGGACDDGNSCTTADACLGGKCVGQGECQCTPVFSPDASKLTAVDIGNGGKPGEGLDIDNNPATCAPDGSCSGGIDNALGALAGVVNAQLDKAVASGSVTLLVEYKDFKQGPISLALYQGKLDASNATCDVQTQSCAYDVSPSMMDLKKCTPLVSMPGTLAGNALVAGGPGTNFPFNIPIQAGVNLAVTIYGARLVGTVELSAGKVTTITGILGGAVPKDQLMSAIDALPDAGLPVPKDTLKAILDSAVTNDIDTNGDGVKDAASIGLKLKGIPATILGLTP